jgi:hypothetical protein
VNLSTTPSQGANDVVLDTTVNQANDHIAAAPVEDLDRLSGHLGNKVLRIRILKGRDRLLPEHHASKTRPPITKQLGQRASIDIREGRDVVADTPLSKRLNSSPMGILCGVVGDHNPTNLNPLLLKVLEETKPIPLPAWHTIVSNQGLSKDDDLPTIRRIRHGLRVTNKTGGEDELARDGALSTKGLSAKLLTRVELKGHCK